jgi:DNA-binding response OmpR family regulator
VQSLTDSRAALDTCRAFQPDLILLDLMMPNVDGFGLIRHIKERGGPRPALIVVSAGDSQTFRQLDGAVVHSILRKPFDIDVLGDLVDAAAKSMEEEQAQGQVLPFKSGSRPSN